MPTGGGLMNPPSLLHRRRCLAGGLLWVESLCYSDYHIDSHIGALQSTFPNRATLPWRV